MFAKERQDEIYEMLLKSGAVTTSKLVEAFHVSIETIRRDLLYMEQHRQLTRVHGGAVVKGNMKPFLKLQERSKEYYEQKQSLSIKATEFIREGDIIGIDTGSTAVLLAESIKEKFSELVIVTHSLAVFNILCNHKNFSMILCGGQYIKNENAFYGSLTLDMLRSLHMKKSFMFPSAVSLKYGICDYQSDLYQIQKQLMNSSDEIFILADSSKFEKIALFKLDDMKNDYIYVTDCDLPEALKKLYKENNMNIYSGGNVK